MDSIGLLKLKILSRGISDGGTGLLERLHLVQNPAAIARTGNNGLFISLEPMGGGKPSPLNVAMSYNNDFAKSSPYILSEEGGKFFLLDTTSGIKYTVNIPTETPQWLLTPVGDSIAGNYVAFEGGSTVIADITPGCIYINKGEGCKFCGIGALDKSQMLGYAGKLKASLEIAAQAAGVDIFVLTGGNTYTRDRGAYQYVQFVEAIKKHNKRASVSLEISPPEPSIVREVFEKLKAAGVEAITMNLEFYSDKTRAEIMPRKGSFPREDYYHAGQVGIEIFGKNKITSGLIVGVEPLEDTKRAIDELASRGILPEPYPFKPNAGSQMRDWPTIDPSITHEATLYAAEAQKKHGIDPRQAGGCIACAACGVSQELYTQVCKLR
ncbi:MAG: radical SAM protein [Alphaproteobacteria bacterium]|nr:radical SAM protein [Alphaproteobacteria bacterium]